MSELTAERLAELRRICTASLENPCNENLAIFDSAFTDERCLMLVDEIERLRREQEEIAGHLEAIWKRAEGPSGGKAMMLAHAQLSIVRHAEAALALLGEAMRTSGGAEK